MPLSIPVMLPEIQLIDKTNGVAFGTPALTWLAHSLSRNLISLAPYSLAATTFRAWASERISQLLPLFLRGIHHTRLSFFVVFLICGRP